MTKGGKQKNHKTNNKDKQQSKKKAETGEERGKVDDNNQHFDNREIETRSVMLAQL